MNDQPTTLEKKKRNTKSYKTESELLLKQVSQTFNYLILSIILNVIGWAGFILTLLRMLL